MDTFTLLGWKSSLILSSYVLNFIFNIDLHKKSSTFNSSNLEMLFFLVRSVSRLLPDKMMHLVLLKTETVLFSQPQA